MSEQPEYVAVKGGSRKELMAMLKRVQFSGGVPLFGDRMMHVCPLCENPKEHGHASWCELAALLTKP